MSGKRSKRGSPSGSSAGSSRQRQKVQRGSGSFKRVPAANEIKQLCIEQVDRDDPDCYYDSREECGDDPISRDKPIEPVVRIRNQHALQCIGLENLYTHLSGQQGRGIPRTDVLTRTPFTARQLEYISTAHRDNIPEGERKDMVWLAEQAEENGEREADEDEEIMAEGEDVVYPELEDRLVELSIGPPLNVQEFRRILLEFPHFANRRARITITNTGNRLRPNLECKTMFDNTIPFQTEHLVDVLQLLDLDIFEFKLPIDITPPQHILHLLPHITCPIHIFGILPNRSRSTPFRWFREVQFNASSLNVRIMSDMGDLRNVGPPVSVQQVLRMPIPNCENQITINVGIDDARLEAHFENPEVIGDRYVIYL